MYQSVCYLHCSKKSLVYSLSLGGWFKPTESKCCFFFAFLGGYRVQKLPDSCWLVSLSPGIMTLVPYTVIQLLTLGLFPVLRQNFGGLLEKS